MTTDQRLLYKVNVSGRVPLYVKQYAKERDLTISDLIVAGFDSYRERDMDHALERLSYHEGRLAHWKGIVLRFEADGNSKQLFCKSVLELYLKRLQTGSATKRQELDWFKLKARDAQASGICVSVEELIGYCKERVMKNE